MPAAVFDFVEQLTTSGLLSREEVEQYLADTAANESSTVEDIAKELVKAGKLTKLQAQLAYYGKAKSLVMGSYVIQEKLGEGGMGQVFKARHKRMKREVALKVLASKFVKDANALKRFHREVEAAARLTHPNIVTAYDADEAHGTHYLVMEYVRGQDLGEIVKKAGPLPVSKAVDCVLQAARGLAYAHEQGIVHRDIKPSNLLLDDKGTVKILDMGLARFDEGSGADVSEAGLTGTGTLMGTVDYMAPEQAMDSKTADHRADIYSLGCTLYYLITGSAVYPEDTVMKRIMAHQNAQPPHLPVSDAQLKAVFTRSVAKNPDDRIQPISELITALEKWLSEHGNESAIRAGAETLIKSRSNRSVETTPNTSAFDPTVVPQPQGQSTEPTGTLDLNLDIEPEPTLPSQRRRRKGKPSGKASSRPVRERAESAGKWKLGLIGTGGVAALVLLGVIIIKITRPDGTKIEIEVPVGSKIEMTEKSARDKRSDSNLKKSVETNWNLPNDAPRPAIAPFTAEQAKQHQEEWANYLGVPAGREITLSGDVKLLLTLIPPGEFMMGASDEELSVMNSKLQSPWAPARFASATPQHLVAITRPFYMGTFEVTQSQWEVVTGVNPSHFADDPNRPVENVSWKQVEQFIAELNANYSVKGLTFVLPTEAQWEFAARAGTIDMWICPEDELTEYCWYSENSGAETHPVGQLQPNAFGLHDVFGNVWEWCADWFSDDYYRQAPRENPLGPTLGTFRVNRGGSWVNKSALIRSADRDNDSLPATKTTSLGFRIAATIQLSLDSSSTAIPVGSK